MEDIIGKTIEEAEALYPDHIFRVVIQDDEPVFGTTDYVPNRVNVEIEDGLIIKVVGVN